MMRQTITVALAMFVLVSAASWRLPFFNSDYYQDKVVIHGWIIDDKQLAELYCDDERRDPEQRLMEQLDKTFNYVVLRPENRGNCHVTGHLKVDLPRGSVIVSVALGPYGNNPDVVTHMGYTVIPLRRGHFHREQGLPTLDYTWTSFSAQ